MLAEDRGTLLFTAFMGQSENVFNIYNPNGSQTNSDFNQRYNTESTSTTDTAIDFLWWYRRWAKGTWWISFGIIGPIDEECAKYGLDSGWEPSVIFTLDRDCSDYDTTP